ncbi:MAG: hypothetical protein ACI8TP_003498 [Acidimicrobiales bacterium]|jgi:hypothetical protein
MRWLPSFPLVAFSSAAVVGTTLWLAGRRFGAGILPSVIGVVAFCLPIVLILSSRPGTNPDPKPPPQRHTVEYWDLATGSDTSTMSQKNPTRLRRFCSYTAAPEVGPWAAITSAR